MESIDTKQQIGQAYLKDDILKLNKQMEIKKEYLSLVITGHVDSGKSTTIGHLVYKLGGIDAITMDKLSQESARIDRDSFKYAWIFDRLKTERERGITINTSIRKIETSSRFYTIIDTPGHRDYIKNMITGTSQADAAVLVISSKKGEFEAGISKEGQTREHALLAFTMGVKQMVVVCNKMDTFGYSEVRFEEIKEKISKYLEKVGYKIGSINFVPISGFDGDNLVKRSTYMPWYTGLTLVEALDALQQPKKPIHKPLRFTISERYKIGGIGTVVMGRVQTGILKVGMNICFAPRYNSSSCYSIEKHYETVNEAIPGDIVGINAKGLNSRYTKRGSIAGDPKNDPPMNTESFIAYVIIMNHPGEIKAGYTPVIHVHTAHIACTFEELLAKADRKSGKKIENQPKFLKVGDAGFVKLVPKKPLCIENFSSYAPLGRFVIRDNGKIIGVGVVQEVKRI